jgi:hypothetical protein
VRFALRRVVSNYLRNSIDRASYSREKTLRKDQRIEGGCKLLCGGQFADWNFRRASAGETRFDPFVDDQR